MPEGVSAAEMTLLVALVGVWTIALMITAGVIIRDIVRAWRGTDAQEELTVDLDPARWDLVMGSEQSH